MENNNEHMKEILKLKEELRKYENLVENMPDAIQSVNADGRIIFANRRATEIFGYTRKELLSMMIDDLYAPDLWKDVGRGFQRLIEKGANFNINTAVIAKNGERIEVEVSSKACYDNGNKFTGTVSVLRDIRKRR